MWDRRTDRGTGGCGQEEGGHPQCHHPQETEGVPPETQQGGCEGGLLHPIASGGSVNGQLASCMSYLVVRPSGPGCNSVEIEKFCSIYFFNSTKTAISTALIDV